jgi:hypothetical protein
MCRAVLDSGKWVGWDLSETGFDLFKMLLKEKHAAQQFFESFPRHEQLA